MVGGQKPEVDSRDDGNRIERNDLLLAEKNRADIRVHTCRLRVRTFIFHFVFSEVQKYCFTAVRMLHGKSCDCSGVHVS